MEIPVSDDQYFEVGRILASVPRLWENLREGVCDTGRKYCIRIKVGPRNDVSNKRLCVENATPPIALSVEAPG
ncbi:hypothetical protein SK128_021555 [Halocaridina rubra]|uniref:Uncharacterized protein n=1 Tax=Halocaridina rubra TaxID=373956 RepID=A0AAN8WJU3_HALRR